MFHLMGDDHILHDEYLHMHLTEHKTDLWKYKKVIYITFLDNNTQTDTQVRKGIFLSNMAVNKQTVILLCAHCVTLEICTGPEFSSPPLDFLSFLRLCLFSFFPFCSRIQNKVKLFFFCEKNHHFKLSMHETKHKKLLFWVVSPFSSS